MLWWISVKKFISKNKFRFHWRALSLIFYFLAVDEAVRIHDRIKEGEAGGWIIYYLIPVAIIGLSYLVFLKSLKPKTRNLIILGGALYVGGAIGLEQVGVIFKSMGYGYSHIYYRLLITVEESFEFLGIIVFIKALLGHIIDEYCFFEKEFKNKIVLITDGTNK